jgi:hypothetical protein
VSLTACELVRRGFAATTSGRHSQADKLTS